MEQKELNQLSKTSKILSLIDQGRILEIKKLRLGVQQEGIKKHLNKVISSLKKDFPNFAELQIFLESHLNEKDFETIMSWIHDCSEKEDN